VTLKKRFPDLLGFDTYYEVCQIAVASPLHVSVDPTEGSANYY